MEKLPQEQIWMQNNLKMTLNQRKAAKRHTKTQKRMEHVKSYKIIRNSSEVVLLDKKKRSHQQHCLYFVTLASTVF